MTQIPLYCLPNQTLLQPPHHRQRVDRRQELPVGMLLATKSQRRRLGRGLWEAMVRVQFDAQSGHDPKHLTSRPQFAADCDLNSCGGQYRLLNVLQSQGYNRIGVGFQRFSSFLQNLFAY
jgi:hypothetical protein